METYYAIEKGPREGQISHALFKVGRKGSRLVLFKCSRSALWASVSSVKRLTQGYTQWEVEGKANLGEQWYPYKATYDTRKRTGVLEVFT